MTEAVLRLVDFSRTRVAHARKRVTRRHALRLAVLGIIAGLAAVAFMTVDVNLKYLEFVLSLRVPKLAVIALVALCIGAATIVFQTIINNTIVTPCLLGMNSLYILIHTGVIFAAGASSVLVLNPLAAFTLDMLLMAVAATALYGYLFKKTRGNVLYVLLAGTVMATLFTSLSDTLQRAMDPAEYDVLQSSIIASFTNINVGIIGIAVLAIAGITAVLWRDIKMLDVMALGRDQAINLGLDYERTTRRLLIGVALFIAIATALVGPISFLGLIIANVARQFLRTYRHSYLMLASVLMGMVVLYVGQTLVEQVFVYTTTVAVFINIGGGLYFLYLLFKNRART